ncbi:alanine racemase [bacterium]|nr:alanine racemase [bacterium]
MANNYNRVELSSKSFSSNLDFFNEIISDDVVISIVIKSNAYGHGIREIAEMAIRYGVEYYCVFSLEEALILREMKITEPILVLGYIPPEKLITAIENDIRITVYNIETLRAVALAQGKCTTENLVHIHLKLETGTNRFGFSKAQVQEIVHMMPTDESIIIEGVFTHFANIEDTTDHTYAMKQLGNFNEMIMIIEKYHGNIPIKHCACSAAILLFPDSGFSMVRLGISLYGLWPSKETYLSCILRHGREKIDKALTPIICWKSIVAQIKEISKGEYIGYGCTYRTTRESKIAVIPTGYSDGYDRLASGRGYVLIRGERAPVRGRVCMNLMMVDVSDISDAHVGDEVVLLGKQKGEVISAEDIASWTETINYEVVTRISRHLPREIVI